MGSEIHGSTWLSVALRQASCQTSGQAAVAEAEIE